MNIHIDIDPDFKCEFCYRQVFDYLERVDLIECTFCTACYSPAEANRIPYDEMRRLCGLPDVSEYVARRDATLAWDQLRANFQVHAAAFGRAFTVIGEAARRALVPITVFAESIAPEIDPHNASRKPGEVPKPKRTPPMWAIDPSHSPRNRNRATDIRTPFR
ncbi:hypothetical protein [Rhodococcus erythropolis]|uniref:hypothetical protein n=1 Tax=Rhodococcus erythropolis TaxID=1833 RepID=UPI000878802D|nr:hypothetical protein [Rhodococcus erythropolis]OFV78492.1 hypothetical protein RERY_09990 [Rhodococcus erythropolis]